MEKLLIEEAFWKTLKNSPYEPNFWCSEKYWTFSGWKVVEERIRGERVFRVTDGEESMLPVLNEGGEILEGNYWASFINQFSSPPENLTFLDYNILYNSEDFYNLEGRCWMKFRKNSRKWPKRNPDFHWIFEKADIPLMIKWAEKRSEIWDMETLEKALRYKGALLLKERKAVAWISWDDNYYARNFRWLICDPEEEYLDEYCRLYFYRDLCSRGILVNDGGVLNSESLLNFKRSLNPEKELIIYSKEMI